MAMDAQTLRSGAESGMDRFCEQAFDNPESAKVGSQALLSAFNDSGLWLANLIQPQHLVAELRQHCCTLTRVVTTQWTHQGETLKLVRLAEALESAQPPVLTHEAGQIMALLASLLGILRPAPNQAPRWLQLSRPLLRDSVDPHLLAEAAKWVSVGQLLAPLPLEERLFWNRRLRDPLDDWEWESSESLAALRRLRELLPAGQDCMSVFQAALPPCWWELWQEGRTGGPVKHKQDSLPSFLLGLATGIGCMMLAGWWVLYRLPLPEWVYFQTEGPGFVQPPAAAASGNPEGRAGSAGAAVPVFEFHPVDVSESALDSSSALGESSGQGADLPALPYSATTAANDDKKQPVGPAQPLAAIRRPDPPAAAVAPLPAARPPSPAMQMRLAEAARFSDAARMSGLDRLYNLVKHGSLREATPHVQGRTALAPQGSSQHRLLLRWLLLDPPADLEVQALVAKTAVRTVPYQDLYGTLILCLHSDSPNLAAVQECADLLLAIGSDSLGDSERQKLASALAAGAAARTR